MMIDLPWPRLDVLFVFLDNPRMTSALDDIDGRRFLFDSGWLLKTESERVPSVRVSVLFVVIGVDDAEEEVGTVDSTLVVLDEGWLMVSWVRMAIWRSSSSFNWTSSCRWKFWWALEAEEKKNVRMKRIVSRRRYPVFRTGRGRSDCVESILTELIFDTVESSEPSESTSSPGVSEGSEETRIELISKPLPIIYLVSWRSCDIYPLETSLWSCPLRLDVVQLWSFVDSTMDWGAAYSEHFSHESSVYVAETRSSPSDPKAYWRRYSSGWDCSSIRRFSSTEAWDESAANQQHRSIYSIGTMSVVRRPMDEKRSLDDELRCWRFEFDLRTSAVSVQRIHCDGDNHWDEHRPMLRVVCAVVAYGDEVSIGWLSESNLERLEEKQDWRDRRLSIELTFLAIGMELSGRNIRQLTFAIASGCTI